MRRFHSLTGVLSISDDERNEILQKVEANDPAACFKQAQIYRYLHNCDDYVSSAHELLKRASESGIADADAAIAIMMFRGEIEPYNPRAAAQLLEKALKNNSELAAEFHLQNLIFGRYGCQPNHELAMKLIDTLIAESDNPKWYWLKGEILSSTSRNKEAVEWYERAIEGGLADAYDGLAFAKSMDDENGTQDKEIFMEILREGDEAGNPTCMYYASYINMLYFDDCEFDDKEQQDTMRNSIINGFELCIEDHLPSAFEVLGDIYREGKMGVDIDLIKAWQYYLKGSEYMVAGCFEKMYDMLLNDEIELKNISSEEAMDLCMMNGARQKSTTLLIAAVNAYKHGRLTKFAREIEMYHIPAYDAIEDEPSDDDDDDEDIITDDDGRYDAWA